MPDILASRLFTLASLLGVGFAVPEQVRSADNGFDWASVKPPHQLKYHDCHGGFKCARLQVPLDWSECAVGSSYNATAWAAIAIITLPAVVSKNDPSFRGTVLINPDGPRGSGTMETIQGGQYLQGIIDGDKNYGILASILEGSNDSLRANEFLSVLCAGASFDSIFAHVSTVPVARDMLEIVDRIDKQKRKSCDKKSSDVPKLQYLGVSYGTLLGNTFASMFPGRVSRMLLDSFINADDYIQKGTSITPVDAETDSDKSAGGIRKKIDNLIQNLEQNAAVEVHNRRIQLVISHIAKDAIRQMMYQPIVQYGLASKVLTLAVASNYSVLLDTAAGNSNTVSQTDMCVQAGASFPLSEFSAANEAGIAVFYAENTAKHFSEQSAITEESWSHVALSCSGWKFNPKYPYRGPFGYLGPKKDDKNAPDALVLFLSNRYDHATPLFNAYRMSQQHSGSAVAIQEAAGHCTLLTSTSKCTKDIGSRYFATDVVLANKTICQPDCQPGIPYKECPGFVAF